jgi:hypothetical protein
MTGQGYFSEIEGCWLSPEDEHESDTGSSLKAAITALKSKDEKPDALFDAVERLLFEYTYSVRHGQTRHDGRRVEWFIYDSPSKRGYVLISFLDRDEWRDDCYSDEVPLWLLIAILRKLSRIKPLGDQKADETMAALDATSTKFEQLKEQPSRLKLMPRRRGDV